MVAFRELLSTWEDEAEVASGRVWGVVLPEVWVSPGVWLGLVGWPAEASDLGGTKGAAKILYDIHPQAN